MADHYTKSDCALAVVSLRTHGVPGVDVFGATALHGRLRARRPIDVARASRPQSWIAKIMDGTRRMIGDPSARQWLLHPLRRPESTATCLLIRAKRWKPLKYMVLFLLCGCSPSLFAQEDTTGSVSEPAVTPLESRLISDSELEEYIEKLIEYLPMATQERDPFGAMQDPDAVPTIALDTIMPDTIVMPEFTTPFEDVVRMINVSTIMPADKRFLIGTRSFGVNDVVTFNYRGQSIRARVEAVTSREIRFRNVDNEDVATRALEILPAGMSAGGDSRNIPGLIPTGPNVPIDLDE